MFKSNSDFGGKTGMIKLRENSNWASTFCLLLLKTCHILKGNSVYRLQKENEDIGSILQ